MPVKKGKVNEKVSTKVLAALSTAFGREISFVDDLTYSEYSTELREAMMRVHPDTGGEYADEEAFKILSIERDRIRGKNTEKELKTFDREPSTKEPPVKVKKTKISTSKFFGRDEKKSSPKDSTKDGIGGLIIKIANSVNSIVDTLKEDFKQDENFDKFKKRQEEKKKRKSKENKLEAKKFDGIKKTATKLLKPFKSAWNRVFDFLKTVFFGRILFKLMDWVSDPQNQKKLQSILRFVKDWWPMLLTAYLLFGNAFGRMAVKLTVMISRFAVRLITKIIPKLVAGLAKMKAGRLLNMIPGGKGMGGKLLMSGALLGGGMLVGNAMAGGGGDEDTTADLDTMQFEGQFNGGGLVNNYNQFIRNYNGGGLIQGFKEGGLVQHSNIIQGFNEGGIVTDPEERRQQEEYMLKFVNEERALQGLEPLNNLTYAPGVELTKMRGPGPRTTETSDTVIDLDKGIKTKFETKTMGDQSIMRGSIGQTTEEDRQKFFAENPHAVQLLNIKNQVELDNLGGDISASAKMNGGGLVNNYNQFIRNYNGGGLIQGFNEGGTVMNNQNMMMNNQNMMMGDQIQNQEQFNVLNPFNIIRLLGAMNQADEGKGQFGGGFTGRMMERRRTLAETQGLKQGGVVKGPGGVDKVPARLTAGEFVMSKGAVQKYGVNTLAAMNAAGGGTNIPTFSGGKGRYNEGGLVQPIVEAGSINSYEDAIKAGVKIEDKVAGGMRFGSIKWTEKMPKGLFGLGKQKYQERGTKWIVDGIGEKHNKTLAMSTKDYVNMKMGWTTGSAANVSESLNPKNPEKDKVVRNRRGREINKVDKKDMNLNPVSKNNVLLDYQNEGGQLDSDMQKSEIQTVSAKEVPDFDPKAMRSSAKIQVLGISL